MPVLDFAAAADDLRVAELEKVGEPVVHNSTGSFLEGTYVRREDRLS